MTRIRRSFLWFERYDDGTVGLPWHRTFLIIVSVDPADDAAPIEFVEILSYGSVGWGRLDAPDIYARMAAWVADHQGSAGDLIEGSDGDLPQGYGDA